MSDRPLNATAASLLGFLHHGPLSGWDLVVTAQAVIGDFWTLTQSQVYRELTAMATAGLVVVGQPGPRDRKPYTITDSGRAAFSAWIDREPGPETIRFPLLLTLAFGQHLAPDRLAAFLTHHRDLHARTLAGYEQQQAAAHTADGQPNPFALASLDFGLTYERAVLDWFDHLPTAMTAPDDAPHTPIENEAEPRPSPRRSNDKARPPDRPARADSRRKPATARSRGLPDQPAS